MSDFNPDAFLATEVSESFDTNLPDLPEGEYTATVEDVSGRVINRADGSQTPVLEVTWRIDDPKVCEIFADERGIQARQAIWLKTTDGTPTGPLDRKHNQQLARLREAVGQNQPGHPWQPSMLIGQTARVMANTREGKDQYEGMKFYEVRRVAAL
jgi:hypothetical protein